MTLERIKQEQLLAEATKKHGHGRRKGSRNKATLERIKLEEKRAEAEKERTDQSTQEGVNMPDL